jgi:hypothetical protein
MSIQMVARADRLPVERSGDGLGWLLLIPLGCLLLGQIVLAWSGILPVLDGGLSDPDSYMRLNRVLHLYESGSWFDPTYRESTHRKVMSSIGHGRSMPSCLPAPGCSSRSSASMQACTSGACCSARSAWRSWCWR